MKKALSILEVSQKQNYIYRDKRLRMNAWHSQEIAYVTDDLFFRRVAGDLYDTARNMGYSGGGHTIIQFDSREEAVAFNSLVTRKVRELFHGMELFTKVIECEDTDPSGSLKRLSEMLEGKKALRTGAFRYTSFGLEAEQEDLPLPGDVRKEIDSLTQKPPKGFSYAVDFQDWDENFVAVVHVDGNAMGKRVQALYDRHTQSLDEVFAALRTFSDNIKTHYSEAFLEMAQVVARHFQKGKPLPLRPVVMAGDDVCFVCRGDIALECTRLFIEKLTAKRNVQDGLPYSACAGVAIIHNKYPFFRAYTLAEQLCNNAKKYGSFLKPDGSVSAMDWHIEYGELKNRLEEIRQDYLDKDGVHLELRPMVISSPYGLAVPEHRKYRDFQRRMELLRREATQDDVMARGKLKGLRGVLKQGWPETEFYLINRALKQKLRQLLPVQLDRMPLLYTRDSDGTMRNLIFDVIELDDHYQQWKEGSQ